MASSSVGLSDEQMLQTTLESGIPEQQIDDVVWHRDLDCGSFSPESAILRLGEATANFNPAGSAGPFTSGFDDHMSFGLSSDYNSALDCPWQTPLFTAGGHDMLGMDLDSSFDRSWQFPTNANATPLGVNLTRRASPNIAFELFLNDNDFSGVNLEHALLEDRVSQTAITFSPSGNLSGRCAQLLSLNGNVEGGISDTWLPAGITEQWMNRLPFAKFEEYLNSRHITFNKSESSIHQRVGASLSGSFAIRSLANSLYSASQAMVLQPPDSQNPLQNLEKLISGENTAIMSEQHMTESHLVRILLFSMMNGFAGLNHIPMEDILKSMGHFSTSKLLLQILQEGPPFTSRTLGDNMFRAAIEAKDQRIVQVLLERKLVDVNDTVCFFQNRRHTPVERAASLQALGLVRILVEAGADVNKTHGDDPAPGALRKLLQAATALSYEYRERSAVTATPQLINTLYFLIEKGSKVDLELLGNLLRSFKNKNEVACLISRSIPSVDHQAFFEHGGDDDGGATHPSLVGRTAEELDDNTATTIVQNMIQLCERSGCSKCLQKWPKTIEYAAIGGANRGHFKLVQLLIRHAQSTTKILSAAIRSGNSALIRLVLDSDTKPELDPRAHSLNRLPYSYRHGPQYHLERQQVYDMLPTTPLAEAVRTGNADLITVLEKSGASNTPMTEDRLEALVFAAAEAGNMPYMERLLKIACRSSHKYRPHSFAVSLALENGHNDVAESLLSAGAEVSDAPTSWYRLVKGVGSYEYFAPLGVALLRKRDPALVCAILSADIKYINYGDIADVASWFDTSILSAIASVFPDLPLTIRPANKPWPLGTICERCMETHNLPFFKILLEFVPLPASWLGECLPIAVGAGHSEMVDLLLQMGASPFNSSVLKAAIPKRTQMLQLLFGEDRKQQTGPKCIGAHILKFVMAERPGNAEVLNSLLDRGLVNLIAPEACEPTDGEMLTPLGLAIVGFKGHCETNLVAVDQLLQAGSDPNRTARLLKAGARISETALMLAIETGREDVVQLLLRNKADVNKKPFLTIKRTPLQYAAELGNLDMVRLLLRYDADVNCEPAIRSGGTALQLAAISGNCNLAEELLKRGAQLHALPSKVNGRWPLEGAAEHGRLDMIEFLWNAKGISLDGAGFQRRQCLRAMDFARSNGHLGCRDLVADLSGISVDALGLEDYGVPWLAY
jgi:ankyrin repeat protein